MHILKNIIKAYPYNPNAITCQTALLSYHYFQYDVSMITCVEAEKYTSMKRGTWTISQ